MPNIQPRVEVRVSLRHGPAVQIAAAAESLPAFDDPAFGALFDRYGDARVVLLGEATCGTSEFYEARAAITRWLVEQRGFNIIALEADGPEGQGLDARVRGRRPPADAGRTDFPSGIWRNREFERFIGWLESHNRLLPDGRRAGVYGLDVYSHAASMRAAVEHLDRMDAKLAEIAQDRYGCPDPWTQEPPGHGRTTLSGRYAASEGAVTSLLADRLGRQLLDPPPVDEVLFDAEHTARLVRDADDYYRAMYYGGPAAWSLREGHMFDTLQALLDAKGPDARAVVWAHNIHVGDARATEMGMVRDEVSLGQLCREAWGQQSRLIGLGTHAGAVACAPVWGSPAQTKALRPSQPGSQERLFHDTGIERFLLDFQGGRNTDARRALGDPRPERFIGAVYHPDVEQVSHYADCRLSEQFDAWVWFDETHAVTSLAADPGLRR